MDTLNKDSEESKKNIEKLEQEILAMPEDDYMNQKQLDFFKQKLIDMRLELIANAKKTTKSLQNNQRPTDPTDRATIEEGYILELRTRDRESKLVSKIQQALVRIDNGSYGWCEETGEKIGLVRLMARPIASLCIEAQQRKELLKKHYN